MSTPATVSTAAQQNYREMRGRFPQKRSAEDPPRECALPMSVTLSSPVDELSNPDNEHVTVPILSTP